MLLGILPFENTKLIGVLSHKESSVVAGGAEDGLPDESGPELESFEQITEEMCQDRTLYFFARADREKDDW